MLKKKAFFIVFHANFASFDKYLHYSFSVFKMHGTKDFLNDFPRLFLAHSRSLGGNNMVVSMILGITDNERAIFL